MVHYVNVYACTSLAVVCLALCMFHTIHGATVVCARPQPTQPSWPPPKREQHDEVDEVLAISDEDNVSTWSRV